MAFLLPTALSCVQLVTEQEWNFQDFSLFWWLCAFPCSLPLLTGLIGLPHSMVVSRVSDFLQSNFKGSALNDVSKGSILKRKSECQSLKA